MASPFLFLMAQKQADAGDFASAEAAKGQCKQAKPAIALWKPSVAIFILLGYRGFFSPFANKHAGIA